MSNTQELEKQNNIEPLRDVLASIPEIDYDNMTPEQAFELQAFVEAEGSVIAAQAKYSKMVETYITTNLLMSRGLTAEQASEFIRIRDIKISNGQNAISGAVEA